jgi:hypothetical protein
MANRTRAILLVGLVLGLATFAMAQKPSPKYDKATETKLTSVVQDLKTVTVNGQERLSLIVKDGTETIEVYVAPKPFLMDMSTDFAKGDQVEITGSKVKVDEATIILAREVVKGNNTLVLRDKAGEPVWSWMEKKTAEGK